MRFRRNIFVLPSGDDLRIKEGIIGTHDEYDDRDDVVDDDVDGYDDIVVYRSCGGIIGTQAMLKRKFCVVVASFFVCYVTNCFASRRCPSCAISRSCCPE